MPLIEDLAALIGAENVLTGVDAARYGHEWTGKYHWQPNAVLRPANTGEVAAILSRANADGTAVVPVGGHTGLTGATEAEGALMLSLERMNRIREIRPEARIAIVEAGVVLSRLHEAAAEHGLAFPLTFGARGSAMIGGCLSTNAGGSNVVRYGNTRALCLGLEVVLADGRVMNLMSELHKDNSGYDLRDLFIGAEGTLGVITQAVLKLTPRPRAYATAMVALASLSDALSLLNRLQMDTGGAVEAFEYMPGRYMDRLAACRSDLREPFSERHEINVLVEVGATAPADATPLPDGTVPIARRLEETLAGLMEKGAVLDAVLAQNDTQRAEMWARREAAAEITLNRHPLVDTDLAVPLDRVETFLTRMQARLAALDPKAEDMVVAHLGDGNIHYTAYPSSNDPAKHDAIREAVEDVTAELGGSFSAEHGIGLSKLSSMRRRKDPVALSTMRAIKTALDPKNILNPGKTLP
ncbi:FAD-binding oxidoreductase [Ostreiculturibacter nitratireducens]|uniref:FAD-binding oxidoreductase n=1 Tax=Ostreiculturibacter nitratireducens TaxID=3075226 RepID=UPI0031B62E62